MSPTVVQAATTDPSATTSDPSDTGTTVTFGAMQLPYVLITDSHGKTTKVPWYPDVKSQIIPRDTILGDDNGLTFANDLKASEPNHPDTPGTAGKMAQLADSGSTLKPGDKFADYLISRRVYSAAKTSADITSIYETIAYSYAWLFESLAKAQLHQTNFTAIHADYIQNVLSKLKPEKDMIGSENWQLFENTMSDESKFNDMASALLNDTAEFHLDSLTVDQLARLDPTASKTAEAKLLQTPMTDLVTKQTDGTMLADGLLSSSSLPSAYVLKSVASSTATSHPVTVHYVDEQGNTLKPDKTLTGSLGEDYKTEPLSIDGYQLVKTTGDGSGKFTSSDQSVTYTYRKAAANIVVKDSVVYATKKIGLYASPKFSKQALLTTYAKKSRMNRPMFKVIGTATSKNGVKHYKVKDLNGKGTTGYITTKSSYVTPLYYAKKQKRVTVINANGLNSYTKSNLTGKAAHYKQGQVLKIKQIIHHNLTTRFVLNNGKYISANKKTGHRG
ncbi:hypothetical protein FD13_GL001256 [Levilactobacillus senmaizukei DSM 21775 = NBRC 103853]|uniref:MucBP domain-containing protein n=1 Tax=Levilactobacillus senmaizukei DSM 21775 = NBRC 103853 TaxID=1423803 RepID=A0A0R2DRB3_9LACO|nr:hypothetical protein FD13_GL001256 [Levilactobacillus senmaizukei DSM 21775 = NBRC 103853]